jgi:hypothetical protein
VHFSHATTYGYELLVKRICCSVSALHCVPPSRVVVNFQSNSITLKGGVEVKTDVYVPTFLMDYEIPDSVWEKSIEDFNKKLNDRPSVTCLINGINVDILRMEVVEDSRDLLAMGAVLVYMVARPIHVQDLMDIHFIISGFVTFDDDERKSVRAMTIENITYGGDDSKKFQVLK